MSAVSPMLSKLKSVAKVNDVDGENTNSLIEITALSSNDVGMESVANSTSKKEIGIATRKSSRNIKKLAKEMLKEPELKPKKGKQVEEKISAAKKDKDRKCTICKKVETVKNESKFRQIGASSKHQSKCVKILRKVISNFDLLNVDDKEASICHRCEKHFNAFIRAESGLMGFLKRKCSFDEDEEEEALPEKSKICQTTTKSKISFDYVQRFLKKFDLSYVASKDTIIGDATIVCKDGKFTTHRLLLAAISPFLRSIMQKSGYDDDAVIILPDQDVAEVMNLLQSFFIFDNFDNGPLATASFVDKNKILFNLLCIKTDFDMDVDFTEKTNFKTIANKRKHGYLHVKCDSNSKKRKLMKAKEQNKQTCNIKEKAEINDIANAGKRAKIMPNDQVVSDWSGDEAKLPSWIEGLKMHLKEKKSMKVEYHKGRNHWCCSICTPECSELFENRQRLVKHLKLVHKGNPVAHPTNIMHKKRKHFCCPYCLPRCSVILKTAGGMRRHVKNFHLESDEYERKKLMQNMSGVTYTRRKTPLQVEGANEGIKVEGKTKRGNKEDMNCPICRRVIRIKKFAFHMKRMHNIIRQDDDLYTFLERCTRDAQPKKKKIFEKPAEEPIFCEEKDCSQPGPFKYYSKFKAHSIKDHKIKLIQLPPLAPCPICDWRGFTNIKCRTYHLSQVHSIEMQVKKFMLFCNEPECNDMGFSKYTEYEKHCDNIHYKKVTIVPPVAPCPQCGKRGFRDVELRTRHLNFHRAGKEYYCGGCGLPFETRERLKSHEDLCLEFREATLPGGQGRKYDYMGKTRSHECYFCNKTFFTSLRLRNHILIHTGEKPHRCNICDKTYRHKWNLNHHFNTEHRNCPYKCPICNKGFAQNHLLSKHLATSHGVRPEELLYKCQSCDSSFDSISKLVFHVKNIHGNGIVESADEKDDVIEETVHISLSQYLEALD